MTAVFSPDVAWSRVFPGTDWTAPGRESLPGMSSSITAQIAGALPVGQAAYPLPVNNAVYVSASSGSDSNSGAVSGPKKTIAAAVGAVPAGGTVVVRAGIYHETVGQWSKAFTLQPYPNEEVWLDGSAVVTGWTSSGGKWIKTGWTAEWTSPDIDGSVGSQNPIANRADMVFIDGVRQWHVSSNPGAGQFSIDYGTDTITLGTNPSGKEVRVTDLTNALIIKANITVRGIGIRRYACPNMSGYMYASVIIPNDYDGGATLENVWFEDGGASLLLSCDGDNITVQNCTFIRGPHLAIGGYTPKNLKLRNLYVKDSNWKNYNANPQSSAIKITQSQDLVIEHNYIDGCQNCCGIWLDISNYNFKIVNNLVRAQGVYGINAELSAKGIVAGNRVYGTPGTSRFALAVQNSGDVRFWNNYITSSRLSDIELWQDERRNGPGKPGDATLMPWVTKNIEVVNNIVANDGGGTKTGYQMYGRADPTTNYGMDLMVKEITANVFSATMLRTPPNLASDGMVTWVDGADNRTKYNNPETLKVAKPTYAFRNLMTASQTPTDAELAGWASNASPLPADIAAALGVAAGLKVVGPPLPAPILY